MTKPNRTKSIKIRVTEDEKAELLKRADGRELAPFMREFCLTGKYPKRRKSIPKLDPEQMRLLTSIHIDISRIGNNLNQLTKIAHINKDVDFQSLLAQLNFIRRDLKKVVDNASNVQ